MISASTLFCYSALSSRILITNRLVTFLTLHYRYPVLQPINTYYSLIGAVYVFRACALFSPRIASPLLVRYYPHVLSISCDCSAPPHFPESQYRMFYPSVYLKSTHSLYRREFVFFDSVLYTSCYSCPEILVLKFLFPVSCSLFPLIWLDL